MFNWIKTKLNWFFKEPDPPKWINVLLGDKIEKVYICGQVGLKLQCSVPSESSVVVRLIGPDQAADTKEFWKAWKSFGNKMTWEDGTPFVPTK